MQHRGGERLLSLQWGRGIPSAGRTQMTIAFYLFTDSSFPRGVFLNYYYFFFFSSSLMSVILGMTTHG